MFPRTLRNSLGFFPSIIALVHCSSIEFFIDQTFDECSRNSETVACANNTNRGGLCAYAPDTSKLWCCPAPNPYVQWRSRSIRVIHVLTSCCWGAQDVLELRSGLQRRLIGGPRSRSNILLESRRSYVVFPSPWRSSSRDKVGRTWQSGVAIRNTKRARR